MKSYKNKGWTRGIALVLQENDVVEITAALKHYHDFLLEKRGTDFDWPEVRSSLRQIIRKLYHARDMEDQDPVREEAQ